MILSDLSKYIEPFQNVVVYKLSNTKIIELYNCYWKYIPNCDNEVQSIFVHGQDLVIRVA